MRLLCLGDSYTIGERVALHEGWPARVAAMLRERGVAVDEPQIVATTGWTTEELDAGINAAQPRGPFDVVTLLIGVNNQYRGRGLAEYRTQFTALLERAVAFAGGHAGHVLVISIPDWGAMPFAEGRDRTQIAREIDAFNAANREIADSRGCRYCDVTGISREAARDASLVADDGLHPSGAMYARWTDVIASILADILSS